MPGIRSRRHSNDAAILRLFVERLGEKKHSSVSFTASLCLSRFRSLTKYMTCHVMSVRQSKAKLLELFSLVPYFSNQEMENHANVGNTHNEMICSVSVQDRGREAERQREQLPHTDTDTDLPFCLSFSSTRSRNFDHFSLSF
jgi:hypothetical protein